MIRMAKNKFQALLWGKNRCVELSEGLVNENKAHCTETIVSTDRRQRLHTDP